MLGVCHACNSNGASWIQWLGDNNMAAKSHWRKIREVHVNWSAIKTCSRYQVRHFQNTHAVTLPAKTQELKLVAVAVNEDNKEDQVFTDLAKGKHRICYAS